MQAALLFSRQFAHERYRGKWLLQFLLMKLLN